MIIRNQMFFPMILIVNYERMERRIVLEPGTQTDLGQAIISRILVQHHATMRGIEVLNPEGDTE